MSQPQQDELVDDEGEAVMTDADFERAMEQLESEENEDVGELLRMMNENRMISWEEAEQILGGTPNEPIKSSLPQQTRPTEPDNDTDVDRCIQRLLNNDAALVEINLNNMKRTPIPQIKRVIEAIYENTCLEKLSLANMGLYDNDVAPLIDVLGHNETLRCVNLETNYLSGDFFARLFKAALTNQTVEEVKAVNQGVSFSTQAEREIINSVTQNRGLTKVSINLRLPEGRYKIEQATIRNQEIRRILRRQEIQEQRAKQQAAAGAISPPADAHPKPVVGKTKAGAVGSRAPPPPPAAPAATAAACGGQRPSQPYKGDTDKSLRGARQSFESPLKVAGAEAALNSGKQLYGGKAVGIGGIAAAAAAKAGEKDRSAASGGLPDFSAKKTGAVADRAAKFREQKPDEAPNTLTTHDKQAQSKAPDKAKIASAAAAAAAARAARVAAADGNNPTSDASPVAKPKADGAAAAGVKPAAKLGKFEKKESTDSTETPSSPTKKKALAGGRKSPTKSADGRTKLESNGIKKNDVVGAAPKKAPASPTKEPPPAQQNSHVAAARKAAAPQPPPKTSPKPKPKVAKQDTADANDAPPPATDAVVADKSRSRASTGASELSAASVDSTTTTKKDPLAGLRRGGAPRLPATLTSVSDRAKVFGK